MRISTPINKNSQCLSFFKKTELLASLKNRYIFQNVIVRAIFSFILLFSLLTQTSTAIAETISNTVSASYSINGITSTQSDNVQFNTETPTGTGVIQLRKLSDTTNASVGQTITYTLLISNTGNASQNNLIIKDIFPTGFSYIAGSVLLDNHSIATPVNVTGNQLNIKLGEMPAKTNWALKYKLRVNGNAPAGLAINTANVTSDTDNSSASQANVFVNKVVTPPPVQPPVEPPKPPIKALQLDKQANLSTAKVGQIIRYTLTISNPNEQLVKNVNLVDTLPTGLKYQIGSALFNGNKIHVKSEEKFGFALGDMPKDTVWTLSYDVKIEHSIETHSLVNQAYLTANDPKANSNTAKDTVEIIDDEINIAKKANKTTVSLGETVEYTVTINSSALHDLNNLVIRDTLPSGFIYQVGSAKINQQTVPTDKISFFNSTLTVSVDSLAQASNMTLSYIVTVTENSKSGNAINQVSANSHFAVSDIATATVKVRTPSTITFYIIDQSGTNAIIPVTSFTTDEEIENNWQDINNIQLADGSTVALPTTQPIVVAEEYSLVDPVVIEVRDLDQNENDDTLETIIITIKTSSTNDQEILQLTETAPDSGIFRGIIQTTDDPTKSQNGVLTIADETRINVTYRDEEDSADSSATAALVVPETPLVLAKTADKSTSAIGELVRYTLKFKNTTGFDLPSIKVNDTLPIGFRLVPDSTYLNGIKLVKGIKFNGRLLEFNLNNMPEGKLWTLEYVTKVSAGSRIGNAVNRAVLTTANVTSNHASATVKIIDDLMRTQNILTGRVFIGCESMDKNTKTPKVLENARIYLETGRSILSDKEGFWHMEGVSPGSHVLQLDEDSLPAGYEAILCNENTRHAGDAMSQFVNLQAGSLWQVNFHVKATGNISAQQSTSNKTKEINPIEQYGKTYLNKATSKFEVLWPKNNYVPSVASTSIIIKSAPSQQVELILNGKKVKALNYEGSTTNKANSVIIRRWTGVDIDINNRENKLLVMLKNKKGQVIAKQMRIIHFSGKPSSAEFLEDESVLIADGKTTPVIALLIKDQDGFPMRANTHGYFTLENNNFTVKTLNSDKDRLNLNESIAGDYKYHIKEDGIARIELNPTSQSGQLKLNIKFSETRSKSISVWLKPRLRKWILVGIAEGTLAHKTITGNIQSLNELGKSDEFYKRGRFAFFAKGQVKGKYLLTMAYDTHKQNNEVGSQLNGNLDPDAWYTVYADNSNSQYDAPSSRKLYLKIEKDNFYTLFGDYHTDMTVTELARYQRVLNGFKSEYHDKHFSFKGFVSETSNNHHHEEIPGDGTSGLYHLKHRIVANSESIRIETRDRFHSDVILESRQLSRYQDYDIDYDAGTLYFKFPVTGRDSNLNPNIIVADYDTDEDSNKSISAGGRIALKSFNDKLETGLSIIHLGRNNAKDDRLVATDITYDINNTTKIYAEIAQSKTERSDFENRNAYIIELEKDIAKMEARIFHKKQDSGFGINSQASENGIEKTGAIINYKLSDKTKITSEIAFEKNLENDNKRRLAEIGVEHHFKRYEITTGIRHSEEEFQSDQNGIDKLNNTVALLGGSYTTKNNKVTLRGNIEKKLSSNNGSEISPDRVIIGVDVKIKDGISVFAEHETTDNGDITTQNTRVGVNKSLWKGAQAKTSYTQERTDQGQRNYATLGLSQKIKINDKIRADFSIDKSKTVSSNQKIKVFNEDEPARQGTQREDYTAFSVGIGSDDKAWSWTTRAEYRDAEIEDKISFLAGVIRHLADGKNLSAQISYYHTKTEAENNPDVDTDSAFNANLGSDKTNIKISLGSAWHPKDKDFVFFNRLDLIEERKTSHKQIDLLSSDNDSSKIIHNLHYSHRINNKTQIGIHHGIKYIKETNGNTTQSTTVDTATIELRRDLNKRIDIGIHAGYLHDWKADTTETVTGISVGVTPAKNAWVELGYNFQGFDDEDFDKNNYRRQGPYVDLRYKFNQDSLMGKDLPIRRTGNKEK